MKGGLLISSERGMLSSQADAIESEQMRDGHEVLAQARGLLERSDKRAAHQLQFIAFRLTEDLPDEELKAPE